MDEIDIWRSATLLVDKHGNDAEITAAQRADALMAEGDMDGHMLWVRIVKAVRELLNETPDGPVH